MASLFPPPGPSLPQFKSLVITGQYHPSAPIHLCLSRASNGPPSKALLLSPSRQALKNSFVEFNNDILTTRSGTRTIVEWSSRLQCFYPPTLGHLLLLLSLFHLPRATDTSPTPLKKVELAPSLLVLHEPSEYFLSDASNTCTISSYLELVVHALAALSFLGGESSSFALFDSQLDRLKLPILRHPDDEPPPKNESVIFFVEQYCEWAGSFYADIAGDSEGHASGRKLRLRKTGEEEEVLQFTWKEAFVYGEEDHECPRRSFTW